MIDWVQMGGKGINEFRIAVVSRQQPTTPNSSPPSPNPPPPPYWPLLPSSFPGEGQIRRQCHIQIKQQAYYEQKVMLATYMRRMRKTTWRLSAGSSCRPQLNHISTGLWQTEVTI